MNIGEVSRRTGVPSKTIRYYEEIELVPAPARGDNGYRQYTDRNINVLDFVSRSRSLGFTVEECRNLLALYEDRGRASADVRAIAKSHIAHIDAKLKELAAMRSTLSTLVDKCHGDDRPDCPILEELAAPK
ncbi:MAG: Cu(I)-responsive transcriptional regulator [Parvibaculaceae bacterium]|nr:Cu(I)-responsive transcriptional regulator [Parvibaculaceae bacterium]